MAPRGSQSFTSLSALLLASGGALAAAQQSPAAAPGTDAGRSLPLSLAKRLYEIKGTVLAKDSRAGCGSDLTLAMPKTLEEQEAVLELVREAELDGRLAKGAGVWLGGHWNSLNRVWEWDDHTEVDAPSWVDQLQTSRKEWGDSRGAVLWISLYPDGRALAAPDNAQPLGLLCQVANATSLMNGQKAKQELEKVQKIHELEGRVESDEVRSELRAAASSVFAASDATGFEPMMKYLEDPAGPKAADEQLVVQPAAEPATPAASVTPADPAAKPKMPMDLQQAQAALEAEKEEEKKKKKEDEELAKAAVAYEFVGYGSAIDARRSCGAGRRLAMPKTTTEWQALRIAVQSKVEAGVMEREGDLSKIWLAARWNVIRRFWEWDDHTQIDIGLAWAYGEPSAAQEDHPDAQVREPWLCMDSRGQVLDVDTLPVQFAIFCEGDAGKPLPEAAGAETIATGDSAYSLMMQKDATFGEQIMTLATHSSMQTLVLSGTILLATFIGLALFVQRQIRAAASYDRLADGNSPSARGLEAVLSVPDEAV